ncbi:Acg family FMN-binding oxidoreductase [Azospirillum sp. sgz302134]
MKRRAFLRLAGGGIVVAAAGWSASGLFDAVPPPATAAWAPSSAEPDVRVWALSHALLAPNPHNLQPWMADLGTPGAILLTLDPERRLPATDPFGRQILMGAGAFLELLTIAAAERGHRADIALFPDGEPGARPDDKPFARVRLAHDPAVPRSPLFASIPARRTERGPYDPHRPATSSEAQTLADSLAGLPVTFGVASGTAPSTADLARLNGIRSIVRDAWRVEMTTERTFMESLRLMRIGAAEIDRHRDGISIADPMLVAAAKVGLFDRETYPGASSMTIESQIKRFDALTDSTPSYLWIVTDGNSRPAQIDAGRAYARLSLAGTGLGLAMHPNEQALQEYPEMADNHRAIHHRLDAPHPARKVQMLARLGRLPEGTAPSPPAPRRGLAAHLKG